MDGGVGLRFSPLHPGHTLQTSTLDLALRDTQTKLYALDTNVTDMDFKVDDGFNIVTRTVQSFADTGALRYMVSTYDANDGWLREGESGRGRRVVTFANVLRDKAFPLAQAIDFMLKTGSSTMERPVEIEFAGVIDPQGEMKGRLYWLQMRPIIDKKDFVDDELINIDPSKLILKSNTALGHGNVENVDTIIYVRPENFSSTHNSLIADEIAKINRDFTDRGENYVLVGPGRWGSSDTALGIPVKWPDISAARVIVEASLEGYRIEPSQGTHFFQNLTSFGVGYFTINPSSSDGLYDIDFLNDINAVYESEHVRVVKFPLPLVIAINGLKSVGIVAKPDMAYGNEGFEEHS